MKFLAILKDSLRETIDSKIFYVMIGISVLVTLLVLSVSFRQVSAEEQFRANTARASALIGFATQGKGPRYDIEDFQQTKGGGEPWEGDYRFVFVIDMPDDKEAETLRKQQKDLAKRLRDQFKDRYSWIDKIEVTDQPPTGATDVRWLVTTEGSTVKDRRGWPYEPSLFFGLVPLSFMHLPLSGLVALIADGLIGGFGAAVTMLIGVVLTAFFIPNMLRKGTVDLLLAKPIHRSTLLVFKFIGGLTFMFLNTLVIMVGIWLALGLRAQLWVNGLLLCIFVFTFQFAIFYAVSTIVAVLTRSAIASILVCVVAWFVLWVVGIGYQFLEVVRPENQENPQLQQINLPKGLYTAGDIIHFLTPHYKDLDVLTTKVIRSDLMDPSDRNRKDVEKQLKSINWAESLIVTSAYIVVLVGLSCVWFATRDY